MWVLSAGVYPPHSIKITCKSVWVVLQRLPWISCDAGRVLSVLYFLYQMSYHTDTHATPVLNKRLSKLIWSTEDVYLLPAAAHSIWADWRLLSGCIMSSLSTVVMQRGSVHGLLLLGKQALHWCYQHIHSWTNTCRLISVSNKTSLLFFFSLVTFFHANVTV